MSTYQKKNENEIQRDIENERGYWLGSFKRFHQSNKLTKTKKNYNSLVKQKKVKTKHFFMITQYMSTSGWDSAKN